MEVWDEEGELQEVKHLPETQSEGAAHPIFDITLTESESALTKASELAAAVADQPSWARAVQQRKILNIFKKKAIEDIAPILKPAEASVAAIKAKLKEAIRPLDRGMELLDAAIGAYWDKQESIRRDAEAKAKAQTKNDTEDAILSVAQDLAKAGDIQGAEAVLNQPVTQMAVQIPKMEKPDGIVL